VVRDTLDGNIRELVPELAGESGFILCGIIFSYS
jgi:hypothetical protein